MRRKLMWLVWLGGIAAIVLAACRPAGAPLSVPTSTTAPSISTPTGERPASPTPTSAVAPTPTSAANSQGQTSGAHFIVQMGPTCPGPERPGEVCTRPYQGELLVKDASGAEVAHVQTDEMGQATLDLTPGEYTVVPVVGDSPYPRGAEATFTVQAGQYAEVGVELDTGIR